MSSAPDISRAPECSTRHAEWQHATHDRVGHAIERKALVNGGYRLAAHVRLDDGARVEWRILQRAHDARRMCRIAADVAGNAPAGCRQRTSSGQRRNEHPPVHVEGAAEAAFESIPPRHVVSDGRALGGVSPRPIPVDEGVLQRLVAGIGVEIRRAFPANARILQVHADAGMRRDRPPTMPSRLVQMHHDTVRDDRRHPDSAADAPGDRHRQFADVDHEPAAVARQAAGADRQRLAISSQVAARPLRQRPELPPRLIERDVDRAEILRIALSQPPRRSVVRRENAADEGNDRQRMLAVVTYRIDVPPDIAAGCNRRVEPKSIKTRAAASRPDSAAIGTPGPGCVLPPAR
jgi:hypothetical protein